MDNWHEFLCFIVRFLLAIFLVVSTSEVRRVLSSEAAARLTLETLLKENCDSLKTRLACLSSPYRTFDGSCNNLCNTTLGMAGTTLARFPNLFRPTAYDNPVTFTARQNSEAVSFRVIPLPNARNVSIQVFDSSEADATGAPDFTHLTMTWGQFLDHDVTLTELTPLPENATCGTNEDACVVDSTNCIGVDIIHPVSFGPSQELGGLPTAKCIPLRRSTRTPEGEQVNKFSLKYPNHLGLSLSHYKTKGRLSCFRTFVLVSELSVLILALFTMQTQSLD